MGVDRPGLQWRLGKKGKFIQSPEEINQATPGFFCLLQACNICFFFVFFFHLIRVSFLYFSSAKRFRSCGCRVCESGICRRGWPWTPPWQDDNVGVGFHTLCLVFTYVVGCEASLFLRFSTQSTNGGSNSVDNKYAGAFYRPRHPNALISTSSLAPSVMAWIWLACLGFAAPYATHAPIGVDQSSKILIWNAVTCPIAPRG